MFSRGIAYYIHLHNLIVVHLKYATDMNIFCSLPFIFTMMYLYTVVDGNKYDY